MNLFEYTLRTLAYTIADPRLIIVLVLLAVVLYRKNKRTAMLQSMMVGEKLLSPLELTISQIVIGIFGGIFASMLLSFLGIMFDDSSSIEFIFLASLFLAVVKSRFISFPYTAGMLAIVSIIIAELEKYGAISIGFEMTLDICALMGAVGVLTITEGLLIMIDGNRGAIPVFTNRDGRLAGGFSMERCWPVPLAVLFMLSGSGAYGGRMLSVPDWWPVIFGNVNGAALAACVISAMPIYSMMSYKDVTFTRSKRSKAVLSGTFDIIYGIVVIALSKAANYGLAFQVISVIAMAALYEGIMQLDYYMEKKGKVKYTSDDEGITVLEVMPNSMASQKGIRSGDKILEINDDKPHDYNEIYDMIGRSFNDFILKIKDKKGDIRDIRISLESPKGTIGLVLIPKEVPSGIGVVNISEKKFNDIISKIRKNHKDKK